MTEALKAISELTQQIKAGGNAPTLWPEFWDNLNKAGLDDEEITRAYHTAITKASNPVAAPVAPPRPLAPAPAPAPAPVQSTSALNWATVDMIFVGEHHSKAGNRGIVIQYDSGPNKFKCYFQPEHPHHFPRHKWDEFKKLLMAAGAADPGDTVDSVLGGWTTWPNCTRIGFEYNAEGFVDIKAWEFEPISEAQRADLQANTAQPTPAPPPDKDLPF